MDKKATILIVDDDSRFRKTLSDILRAKGYATIAVAKGRTALNRVEKKMPAVAAIDLKLEDISGLEVMKEIERVSPETECIVLTGYASQESAIEAVNLGAYSYLQKPYDVEQLLLTIRRALEKREAQRALRESEEKYRLVVEGASEGIVLLDAKGTILEVNAKALEIAGFDREEVVGRSFAELLPSLGMEAKGVLRDFKDIVLGRYPGERERTLTSRKGQQITFVARYSLVRKGGRVAGISIILEDITERKQAERELRESEERYRDLLENANDMIQSLDPSGRFVYVNRKWLEILGYTRDEVEKLTLWDIVREDERGHCAEMFEAVCSGQEVTRLETVFVSRDGREIYVEGSANAHFEGGSFVASRGIFRDITERKRAEEARRESEEKYRDLVENISDVLYAVDENGVVTYASPAIESLVGYTPSEVVGHSFTEFVHQEDLKRIAASVERILSGHPTEANEYRILTKSGEMRWIRTSSQPAFEGNRVVGVRGVMANITERKRAEEEIARRSEELAALNAISMSVTSTLDLQEIFSAIQERVVVLLDEKYPPLFTLFDESNQVFEVVVTGRHKRILARVDELLGLELAELCIPLSTLTSPLRDAVLAGKPYVTHDGSDMLAELRGRPVRATQKALGVKSIVNLPLWAKDKLVGNMALFSQKEKMPNEGLELLSSIAGQAAIAIENARLYKAQERKSQELWALHETSLDIVGRLDPDSLLHAIIERAIDLLQGRSGDVYLYRSAEGDLVSAASKGLPAELQGAVIGVGDGVAGTILETGEPLVVDDYDAWEGRSESYAGYGFARVVGVPVWYGEELLGLVVVERGPERQPFTEDDVNLLSLLANQAAVAIENARLYEQAQARTVYLETLQGISATLRSTLPLSEVLKTIVRGTAEALGYVASMILLPDERTGRLVLGAVSGSRFIDASLSLTGFDVGSFSVPLTREENLMVRAFLTAKVQALSGDPAPIIVGVEPQISPKGATAVKRTMGAELAACLPLPVAEKTVGVLIVFSARNELPDDERAMLLGVADQAALAIENARLYEETKRRAEELSALYRIHLDLAAQLDLPTLLRTIVQRAIGLLAGDTGGLYLYDPERQDLEMVVHQARDRDLTGIRLSLGEGVCGKVAESREPLVVTDYATWEGRSLHFDDGLPYSVLGVPIKLGETLLGTLYVADPNTERTFDENDVRLTTLFASQAAIAIENARLYEEVLESEEVFRGVFENTVLGVYRTTPDGRILMANPALVRMLGYSSFEELAQRDLKEGRYEPDYPRLAFKERIEGEGQVIGLESAWIRRDGSTLFVRESATAVCDEAGKTLYYEGTVEDITERKRAEAALKESEEKFRSLAERSPNMIFINKRGKIVYANEKCEETIGYTREEFYSHDFDFFKVIAPECMDLVTTAYDSHTKGEEVPPYEYTLITKGGKRIEAINATRLIRYEGESAILGVITDITERKQAEEELQKTLERLQTTLEGTVNALAALAEARDPYTAGHQRRVANLACLIAEEMGLSEEQIDGIRTAGLIHDIGKIYIPAEILSKPTRLTEVEMMMIGNHPKAGYDVLKEIEFPWPVAEIVLQHHEMIDGSGYPQRLPGEEIILEARILAVADVVEAMSSHRPYRPAHALGEAFDEISQNKGTLYDPEVVDACVKVIMEKGFELG